MHAMVKLQIIKDKEKILQEARGKNDILYTGGNYINANILPKTWRPEFNGPKM